VVRLDGKDATAQRKEGTVAIQVPKGASRIELMPKR
jgi:hypothetical protein